MIVGHKVPDPERYGVVVLEKNKVIEIQENRNSQVRYSYCGLYFYTNDG